VKGTTRGRDVTKQVKKINWGDRMKKGIEEDKKSIMRGTARKG